MKLRQGRKNPLNLYVQLGDEPDDDDLSVGYVRNPDVARWIVEETQDDGDGSSQRLETVIATLGAEK